MLAPRRPHAHPECTLEHHRTVVNTLRRHGHGAWAGARLPTCALRAPAIYPTRGPRPLSGAFVSEKRRAYVQSSDGKEGLWSRLLRDCSEVLRRWGEGREVLSIRDGSDACRAADLPALQDLVS